MSGHVQSEVNNEHCTTPVTMTVLGGKDIEHSIIKTEVKEETELYQCTEEMETHSVIPVVRLKCEELAYKEDIQKPVLKNMLDFESQELRNKEDIKTEMVEIDIEEHKLVYKEDGQHEESDVAECSKLMKPEGSDLSSATPTEQIQLFKIVGDTAPGEENILEIPRHIDCDVRSESKRGSLQEIKTGIVKRKNTICNECGICQRKFNHRGNLKVHLRTHTGEKPFGCHMCDVRFKHKTSLKAHLRSHTGEKPFECEICQRKFNRTGNFKRHLKTHSGEKLFECDKCEVTFLNKYIFEAHLRTHTDEKPFECVIHDSVCKGTHRTVKEESSMKSIATHMLQGTETTEINSQVTIDTIMYTAKNRGNVSVNSDNDCTRTNIDVDNSEGTHSKMYISNDDDDKCLITEHTDHYVFKNIDYQERLHQQKQRRRGTGVRNKETETNKQQIHYECEICQRKFNHGGNLMRHMRTHAGEKPYECEICKIRFQHKYILKAHLRNHTGEKPFECHVCQFRFSHKSYLINHFKVHTGEKPFECKICKVRYKHKSILNAHLRTHTGEKPFKCDTCSVRFNQKSYLIKHLRVHSGEKPFECEICQQKFNRAGNLKRHYKAHTGEKPFECEICKVRFHRRCILKAHSRTHVDEKQFECETCKVRFKYKCNLMAHLRTHTGEKPFECAICKVSFKYKHILKSHLRTHTGEKPFQCDICKHRFSSKSYLNKHLRAHHIM